MLRTILLLGAASLIGVACATTGTCGLGLLSGTGTWCGFPWVWLVGFPIAILCSMVFGLPAWLFFRKAGLRRWWQFALGGLLIAVPIWYVLAGPFTSTRWLAVGFFDSFNYLGSGVAGGIAFWHLAVRGARQNAA
jgi:hypothetical protein